MPSVTLNQRIVERMVGVKLPISKLKDRISMLGCDLESIENGEIKVEIFPNRPDMLCEHGLGRALSSFVGVKMGLRKYRVVRGSNKVIVEPSVSMRPYIACAIVRKLKITEEQLG